MDDFLETITFPETIKCGCLSFEITKEKNHFERDQDLAGKTDFNLQKVTINPHYKKDQELMTTFHELLHVAFRGAAIDNLTDGDDKISLTEEQLVCLLENPITEIFLQLLKHNLKDKGNAQQDNRKK